MSPDQWILPSVRPQHIFLHLLDCTLVLDSHFPYRWVISFLLVNKSMTSNQMMDYYVQPQHLYSHSRTCTRSSLCRRPSRLVASLVCYLLDHASVHEISALVTCSSICQTFLA